MTKPSSAPAVCPACGQEILETQVGAYWWTACRCADRVDPLPAKQWILTTEVKHPPKRQAEIDRNVARWLDPGGPSAHHVDYVDYSIIDPNAPRPRIPASLARELVESAERMFMAHFPPPVQDVTPSPTLDYPAIDGRGGPQLVIARAPAPVDDW